MKAAQVDEIMYDEWNIYIKSNKTKRIIQGHYVSLHTNSANGNKSCELLKQDIFTIIIIIGLKLGLQSPGKSPVIFMVLYTQNVMCESLHTDIPKHSTAVRESQCFGHKTVVNCTENNLGE